ncbi:DUF928 domain-containing protein [Pseudanabaena sp. UWO310]|uniref:DUF928 domain-containing protein n=1 Tax=Pseudanabaena sp. UWO310 TaxID=2480795 RepID=UPI0011574B4E|nr:DUF928 domain-containing protein [Pseudanabaena sp. UWO310]TYQ31766.1 DUF928 domain-containing protein [Pseudanabaena sp. UWO310]
MILSGIKKIALGAITVATLAGSTIFVPSAFAQYGLGLSKSAGTGGATRGNLPQITMLVPEDGARTVAARPTFYWYIAPPTIASNDSANESATVPNVAAKIPFKITVFLRDGNAISSKSIFTALGKGEESGLYKLTLPENAPELVKGKIYRLQIRLESPDNLINVSTTIRRDDDTVRLKEIASAQNDLEKARIYVKNAYWYDAIDAYTNWLSQNPQDEVARAERNDLLKAGMKDNTAFSKERQSSLTMLIHTLEETQKAIAIVLHPKILQ